MKREGRQHGMVRNYKGNLNSKSITRINRFETPPTAGLFTKVSSKPTNHSKFTGKCGKSKCFECHSHPSCKSKDKGKGTYKIRSTDVATNHRLISWKVVDSKGNHGLNYVGLSSDQVLGQLSNYYYQNNYDDDDQDYYDEEEDEDVGDHYGDGEDLHHHGYDVDVHDGGSFGLGDELVMGSCHVVDDLIINVSNDMDDVGDGAIDDVKDDDDDDDMGFCDVGFVIEQVDGDVDEGWCLVDEM